MMNPFEMNALVELGFLLRERAYRFTTITPSSHQRYLQRLEETPEASSPKSVLRDLFGWSIAMPKALVPSSVLRLLEQAGCARPIGSKIKSAVRFSTHEEFIFAHSAHPTSEEDSVFFGPDTYRFLRFLDRQNLPFKSLMDIGCGSGAGGLFMKARAKRRDDSPMIYLSDINQRALQFSKVNSLLNRSSEVFLLHENFLEGSPKGIDLFIANPPFMMDPTQRAYRHGGGKWGMDLSIRIVEEALKRLKPGGSLLLYTAAAHVKGQDMFFHEIEPLLSRSASTFTYEEIDPDIFGEELTGEDYQEVERLSAVGLVASP